MWKWGEEEGSGSDCHTGYRGYSNVLERVMLAVQHQECIAYCHLVQWAVRFPSKRGSHKQGCIGCCQHSIFAGPGPSPSGPMGKQ